MRLSGAQYLASPFFMEGIAIYAQIVGCPAFNVAVSLEGDLEETTLHDFDHVAVDLTLLAITRGK